MLKDLEKVSFISQQIWSFRTLKNLRNKSLKKMIKMRKIPKIHQVVSLVMKMIIKEASLIPQRRMMVCFLMILPILRKFHPCRKIWTIKNECHLLNTIRACIKTVCATERQDKRLPLTGIDLPMKTSVTNFSIVT